MGGKKYLVLRGERFLNFFTYAKMKRKGGDLILNWRETFDLIVKMRSKRDAPVDNMGCERLADPEGSNEKDFRFGTLVALMLSSQTKDQVTAEAFKKLSLACPEGRISVQSIRELDSTILNEAISKVGFHRKKTDYIKKTADILATGYDNDIPRSVEELVKLPGVGSKMAYLAMNCAWKENTGIGVDVHVHRISNRIGWCRGTKNPEETRLALEELIPSDLWIETNPLLVGFGQTICLPRNPQCDKCLLADSCPSRNVKK